MRVTLSSSFGMTGSVADADTLTPGAQPARTNTGNGTALFVAGGFTVGIATQDAAAATKQSVPIPSGGAADTAVTNAGITRSGDTMTVSFPVSITVPEGADTTSLPNFQMDFDITNTIEFFPNGVGFGVSPAPPTLNITGGSFGLNPPGTFGNPLKEYQGQVLFLDISDSLLINRLPQEYSCPLL